MRKLVSIIMIIWFLLSAGLLFAEEKVQPEPAAATTVQNTLVPLAVAPAAMKIDTGDTAWMIVATALVMLMTLPGLALFYGGLSKRKVVPNFHALAQFGFVRL